MHRTLTGQKPRGATLPTPRARSAGHCLPTAAATKATNTADRNFGVKRFVLRPVKPPRRSDSLFHSKSCDRPPRFRALVFGLTYEAVECRELGIEALTGCHNDAHGFAKLLRECYGWEDITVMTDEEKNRDTELWPDTKNMLKKLRDLVADACPGDMFVVYYAGHSDQLRAVDDGHEIDGYDEHMIPVDGRIILDDVLRDTLIDPLCNGTRLTAVFDSCHSGTMLDLDWYPTSARKSDETYRRETIDIERPTPRSFSMPAPSTIIWAVPKRIKRFPWMAFGRAIVKFHKPPRRNVCLNSAEPNIPPLVTVNEVPVQIDALTVEVSLHGDISVSDNSSLLTSRTPSTLGESAIHDEPEGISSPPKGDGLKRETAVACKDCEHLATRPPIVNSIAACQDNQQALEDPRKKASIMTPALIGLLTKEPDLSPRQVQKRLQPKLFEACCRFILDRLKSLKERKKTKLPRRIVTFVDEMPWQSVQSGAGDDQHMNEPMLLRRPGWDGKGK